MLILLFANGKSLAQNTNEIVRLKANEAKEMIDARKYDAGIKLLQEARKADPSDFKILYEMGLAYYLKKDFNTAILIFNQLIKMKDINADCYEMFGNILDDDNQSERALEMYYQGLKKFPKSGSLYFQIGNIYLSQKKYNEAVSVFESGIEAEPTYPMNYYRAAKLYCYSNEEVWGMIYGEIFLNLAKSNKYSAEISKLLYDTYLSEIKLTSDSTLTVSFSMEKPSAHSPNPYGTIIYEPTLEQALKGIKYIDLNTLNKVRTRFLEIYFAKKIDSQFPNVLFEYQNKVRQAGHLDAYNHWLLFKGNETMFAIWQAKNKEKWDSFTEWFNTNPIEINENNLFSRKRMSK